MSDRTAHPDEIRVDAWRAERPPWCDAARWDGFLLASHMTVIRNPEGAACELARARAETDRLQAELEAAVTELTAVKA